MEIITYFFTFKNIRNVFITLMLVFDIHLSFSQVDLRTCNYDCTSNNYTLKDVYLSLSNVNGDPITNTTCTIGEVRQVYIFLNYSSNSNSNIYFARLNSDLTIAGVTTFVNVLLGTIVPGDNKKLLYGPFNWTCGDELSLSNTIIAWKTNSNNDPGSNYSCSSYTNSQCDFTNSFIISKPLAVQFTYKACKSGTNTTVKFTSTTNGGIAPYTYAWDFKNDGGTPDSTIANPTFTYTTSNNTAKLTVTDSQNLTNTYIVPIVEPNEIMLSETYANIGCNGGTTTLTLNVTGGTPGYTYSWNTGAVTKDLTNIVPGTYTVTVTDANGCTKTQSFIINQPTTLTATTSQTNATCAGGSNGTARVTPSGGTAPYTYLWSPSGGTNATATDLMAGNYSVLITDTNNCTVTKNITIIDGDSIRPIINPLPSPTTINCPALPAFAEATATDNTGVVDSLTYVDSTTQGNCTGTYTTIRTWTAKDACGNTSLPVSQTITVQDNTKPVWITVAGSLNTTLECSNTIGLANAQTLFPATSDLCDSDVSNIVKINGPFIANMGCTNAGTYTNTWTVTDDCGNISDTFTQTITITDTIAPIWTTPADALNVTLQCSDSSGLAAAQAAAPIATDNCGGTVTYTKTSGTFSTGSCVSSGTYTNTWVAKDVCNNSSTTFNQVITIEDTTAPMWTTTAASLNVTLQCSDTAGLAAAQAAAPVATDNCGGTVTYTKTNGSFVAGSCVNSGTYTNTWIAKDVCNNSSTTFTQVITIEDTTAPMWTTAAASLNVTLQCSDTSGLANAQAMFPVASDLCDADVSNIFKVSGQFMAAQGCANTGTYTNTWTVKDDCGNTSDVFTQVITIEDTIAPTWTTQSTSLNMTLQCSDTLGLANAQAMFPVASDLCDADVSNIVKVSGQFMAAQGCGNTGTYTNTWTVKDDCGNTSETFPQIITIEDTTAPTWTTQATSLNMTLQCSDTSGLANAQAMFPVASDLCDADVSNIFKVSGQFMAAQGCANTGTYTNTWTVKDDCGNTSDVFTQVITIEDTIAPTWTTQATSLNMTLQCSDTLGLANAQAMFPVASDLCDADVSNIVKVSGQFMAAEGCGNTGTYTNTWTVKDDCGNTSETFTQIITIEDTTAPTWTTTEAFLNMTLQCSDTSGLANAQAMFPVASDLCDADVSNIVKVSGQFMAAEGCANAGTYINTWTVKDDCGNISETFTQIITIEDTTAPTWVTETASLNITLQCSDTSGLANAQAMFPVASDLCDADVSNIIKVSGQFMAAEGCANAGTHTNTWTVKDDCGNTSETFTQIITIEDTTAPTWTTQPTSLNMTLQCSDTSGLATAQASAPIATDNCGGTVTYTKISGSFVAGTCVNSGTYTNTWVAKDVCNNSSTTFTQVITIEDTTAPMWTTTEASLNVTLQCSDTAGLANAQAMFPVASDLCDANVSNIVKVSGQFMAAEGCANAGTYINTWTVKDDCGNISETFTQIITIEDTTAPTWVTETASLNITLQCSDTSGLANAQAMFPVASDLCDADVSNIIKVSGQFMAAEGCANAGTHTNTWTVKDDCGNTSETFTQVITLEDTTVPMFTGNLPADITVSCDAVPEPATLQVSDNCNSNLPVVFSETKSNIQNECPSNYTLTRIWSISDCGGNTASHFQIITVRDTTAPTGTAPASVDGLQSIANIPAGSPQDITDAADNCSESVNISITDSNNGGSGCDGNAYILTRTYTLTDCAGNKTELVQTFTAENKISVTGTASNVTCFEGSNGSILVTSSPGSVVVIKNQNNEVVGNTNLRAGVYTLTATSSVSNNNQVCSATSTVTITQPENVILNLNSDACNADSSLLNLSNLLPEGISRTGIWTDISNTNALQGNILTVFGLALGSYTFEYKTTNEDCPRSISLNLLVNDDCKVLACENVVVHNAFSPNGDGINDFFKIDNIDQTTCYPENTVEIYNRWGILVFETTNYNNTTNAFDGTSRGRTTIKQSEGLPTGTYFYIINYKSLDGNNSLQSNRKDGFLYLSK